MPKSIGRTGPQYSIIVPCRGDSEELVNCLSAIADQQSSVTFEVLVVESSDDIRTEEVVESLSCARLVRSDTGLLPGAARNLGARHARGQFLVFTDADCKPRGDWLAAAVSSLDKGHRVAGGAVGHSMPLHPIAVADNLMQFTDFLPGRATGATDALPGCNIAIRKQDFFSLGGFREDLAAGEDILLVEEAARRWPGQVIFDPGIRVRHKGRSTLAQFWAHQEHFGYFRGILGSRLRDGEQQRGSSLLFVAYFCMRRYAYFLYRAFQWDPAGVPRFLIVTPLIFFGLVAYGKGFLKGCRSHALAGLRTASSLMRDDRIDE